MATRQYDSYITDSDDKVVFTEAGGAVTKDIRVVYTNTLTMEQVLAAIEKIKIRILSRGK